MSGKVRHFLFHRYEPIGAEQYVKSDYVRIADVPVLAEPKTARPVTVVLFRCECGKFKTEMLIGNWTLDELRAGWEGKEPQ